MSISSIAMAADMKESKARAILKLLDEQQLIEQCKVDENKRVPRYLYRLTEAGKKYIAETQSAE